MWSHTQDGGSIELIFLSITEVQYPASFSFDMS